MRALDVSMPLYPGMPTFPGDPPFATAPLEALARGGPYNLSRLSFGSHAGTHIDPPRHFAPNGVPVDRLDLDVLNGPCVVVRVPRGVAEVGPAELGTVRRGTRRVLLRTENSARWARRLEFFEDYVGLGPDGARRLVELGVRLVGIDALSVENDPSGTYPVHRALIGGGVLVLEGLLLGSVRPGRYELGCLPLAVRDGDGGPARVVLWPARRRRAR